MAKASRNRPHRGSILPINIIVVENYEKCKKDGHTLAEPGSIALLVDSGNICAHFVVKKFRLRSATSMSLSSRIFIIECVSYFLVTTQRNPSRIRA
jgi:hypothetical protein